MVQDVCRFTENCKAIYDAKGVVIPGLGNRSGRRKTTAETDRRGGLCTRKNDSEFKVAWLHSDAAQAQKERALMTQEEFSDVVQEIIKQTDIGDLSESESDSE